jgi:hypothetical protein
VASKGMTFGLVVVGGLGAASSFYPALDRALCLVLAGGVGGLALYGIGSWFIGEWLLDAECRRSDVPEPHQTPVYEKGRGSS